VLLSLFMLLWQLFFLFACCLGVGLTLRSFVPKGFSLLHKTVFCLLGGLFLAVLIGQNLVYLNIPVRISAWIVLAFALVQVWRCRCKLLAWTRACSSNGELRTLALVVLLTMTFHGVVPVRQGLEWYYGKGHFDQINYVLLAEFLKDEPYSTGEQDIGLRPWLLRSVGYQVTAEQLGASSGPGLEMFGLKKQRIGQSIVAADISVWSGADGKGSYAATMIFFLAVLPICLYVFLRESGLDCFMAGSGALLAAVLPALTRLSLDGFLSQVSILFVFPFFATMFRREELSARGFTLFFSLTLGYLIAAYSEIAPIGLCTFLVGLMFVRSDKFRPKRLMLMSAILLVALMNPYYVSNLIGFLALQYSIAANAPILDNLVPNLLHLRSWSELIFGAIASAPLASFFDGCALLFGILAFSGALLLSRRDMLILGAVLLPALLTIFYVATRSPPSYYPIAKIVLTILPFVITLIFIALSRISRGNQHHSIEVLKKLLCTMILLAAAAGSVRYYSEVLETEDLLRYVREPRFLSVCQNLEKMKNKRVLVFETHPLLTAWLCYHARHNDVYFGGRMISDQPVPLLAPFTKVPGFGSIDFVATRDRIVDLRAPSVPCLTLIDDVGGEDRRDGGVHYWLGPPAGLRVLALQSISANLKMRLAPRPEAENSPVGFSVADAQGHVFQGELWGKNVDFRRMNFPEGLSTLQLSVKAKVDDPNAEPSFPILAEVEGIELSDIEPAAR
jgi:hypothetical protein